jgi:hypothetical protein
MKLSTSPEDTAPTLDDYGWSLDLATGALKKIQWQKLRNLFAAKRLNTLVTATTVTPDPTSQDMIIINGLASSLTINAPSGTPSDGQIFTFRITDSGTQRSITWNTIYASIGVTIPSTTVGSAKVMYVVTAYNANTSKLDVLSVARQP